MNQKFLFVFPSKGIITSIFFLLCTTLLLQSCQETKSTTEANIETKKPFSVFLENEDYWKERVILAQTFQKERVRLGKKFQSELLKLVKDNKERCYWLASFLHHHSYLGEYKPDLALALELLDIGIEIELEDKRGTICENYSMLINCTLISEKISARKRAITYCQRYLKLKKDSPEMVMGCWPAHDEKDSQLIDDIEKIAQEQ
jgi:hypothetical protein